MKKWLFLMAALLLLTGCTAQPDPEDTAPAPTESISHPTTEPTGYYDPESALEASTEGAVRVYPLNRSDSYGLVSMGEDLLLLSGAETTTLTKLSGYNLYVSAAANLDCFIEAESAALQVSEKGVTYFDTLKNQLVFLDTSLKEVNRVNLPEEMLGDPALSADRKHLYYCTDSQLRCLDLETGLDRLLKEMFFPYQQLNELHCDDTVLECTVMDNYGNLYGYYFSTATGETLWETLGDDVELWTRGEYYFAAHFDGQYQEFLTGFSLQEPMLLTGAYGAGAYPLLDMTAAVLVSTGEQSVALNCYDLETGMCDYTLQLPGEGYPWHIQEDTEEDCIWFLRYDDGYASDTICRWDYFKSATGDEVSHLSRRYSADNPDTAGLHACQEIADSISQKHGVEILVWTSATAYQPEDYFLVAEYQAPLLTHWLEKLDQALSVYPSGLLREAAAGTAGGKIKICLVREIVGNVSQGQLEYADGLQYWDDSVNAYVAVAVGTGMEEDLHHELFHVMDSRVMSTCSAYDNWDSLNPDGFAYTYSYYFQPEDAAALLDGENRAFIDFYSMSYPREDRARIMEYAMMPDNEAYFQSAAMQAKLKQLCKGIREAFGLEDAPETFLWEQYLK